MKLQVFALAAMAVAIPANAAGAAAEMPAAARAVAESVGVNVHLHYTNTAYVSEYPKVRRLLVESGIRHIRDGLIDTTWQPYYDRLSELAAAGVHADLVTNTKQTAALIAAYPARVPGAVEAIEGPNEFPVDSPASASTLSAFQTLLYQTVHGSAATNRLTVIGPSLTSQAQYAALGDVSNVVDTGNVHDYFAGRNPGTSGWGPTGSYGTYGSLAYNLALARLAGARKPIVSTESGYGDDPAITTDVPAEIKARYVVRLLLEHWNAGLKRTYLYEFLDEGGGVFGSYGLLDSHANPKPAYAAVKSLIHQLTEAAGNAPLRPLRYTLHAAGDAHHVLIELGDGSYVLGLWAERPSWDAVAHRRLDAPAVPAAVDFEEPVALGRRIDFEDDGSTRVLPIAAAANGQAALEISDRLSLIEIKRARTPR